MTARRFRRLLDIPGLRRRFVSAARTLTLLSALLFGPVFGAFPVAAQTATSPTAEDEGAVAGPVDVEPVADDAAIATRIRRILESTDWYRDPRVAVREGIVFLDGETTTQEHRRWAGALATNTEGTVAVVNRIVVEADVGSTFSHAGEELVNLYRQAVQLWPWALVSALILLIAWLLARLVAYLARRLFARRVASPLLLNIVVRLCSVPLLLLGVYFVLQIAGLTGLALTILGGTGLLGVIVGFAFRDIAENFLASILLSVRNPFGTGDLIEVAGNTGIVQNLNVRSTVLLTLDGNYVQIPNAIVFKSTIVNFSIASSRRADFSVGISYDSSTTKAQALVAEVLKHHPAVLDTPEPLVLVEELGAATVNLRVYYWFVSATYSPIKINSALLRLTKDALLGGGIELPDAAREVIFPRGVPLVPVSEATTVQPAAPDPGAVAREEEWSSATAGEGELRSDMAEVPPQPRGQAPEARENLLKG